MTNKEYARICSQFNTPEFEGGTVRFRVIAFKHWGWLNDKKWGALAKLNGAELNGAKLNGAKLNGAGLNYAELNGAKLNGAGLNGAGLNYAGLNYAELNGAELNGAKLNGAKLNGAKLAEKVYQVSCIGSRHSTTTYDASQDIVWCGCFSGTLREFESKVAKSHGENDHGKHYRAMIAFFRARMEIDGIKENK